MANTNIDLLTPELVEEGFKALLVATNRIEVVDKINAALRTSANVIDSATNDQCSLLLESISLSPTTGDERDFAAMGAGLVIGIFVGMEIQRRLEHGTQAAS